MAEKETLETIAPFLGSEEERRRYTEAYAEIESDLVEIESELDDCQRLSEDDFVIRINARD